MSALVFHQTIVIFYCGRNDCLNVKGEGNERYVVQ